MATELYSYMGSLKDPPIANELYIYDKQDGITILIEHNNTIYMGDIMEYYLANNLQSDDSGIHIDIFTKKYYPDGSGSQIVTLPYSTIIIILYYGVLPYIPVWSPTPGEIKPCLRVEFTLRNSWDRLLLGTFPQCSIYTLSSSISDI